MPVCVVVLAISPDRPGGPGDAKRPGRKSKEQVQAELHLINENELVNSWEYAVLVCNAHCGIENIGQRYCDRADCKNGFDAIRNQWGWSVTGITGHEERSGRYRPGQYGLDNQDMDGFGRVRHRRWIRNSRSPHQRGDRGGAWRSHRCRVRDEPSRVRLLRLKNISGPPFFQWADGSRPGLCWPWTGVQNQQVTGFGDATWEGVN